MGAKKQQEAILAAVCTMRNHPSADEVYGKLRKDLPHLSLATVYRNLNALVKGGDIRRVTVPGAGDRFDFRIDAHEHMLCEICRRVFDIDAEVSVRLKDAAVDISGYSLIFHGVCNNCTSDENLPRESV